VVLFVPLSSDFTVEKPEEENPFDEPIIPLNGIAQYRRDLLPGQRVHVKGILTLQRPGEDLFLQDESGGLQIKSRQPELLAVGEVVEAVGFPDSEHFLPVLSDAVFKKTSQPRQPALPKNVTVSAIESGLHHADLVRLQAKLLDRAGRQIGQQTNNSALRNSVLMLQAGDLRFTAEAKTRKDAAVLAALPIGSVIEVAGICFTESGEDKKLKSLQLLLPDAGTVRVLQKPSWWTPQRLLIGLGVVLAVLACHSPGSSWYQSAT
jgi:hypothetical protein